MKKTASAVILISSLLLSAVVLTQFAKTAGAATIVVPDDYPTIQEAINASVAGDIIVVNSGTYPENVVINKPISLKGMTSGQRPVIVGNQTIAVVKITSNGVEFSGFNVTNGGYGDSYGDGKLGGGIELFCVSDCNVTNNLVYDNLACGISLVNANYNTIANNTCIYNWIGIRLWSWSPQTTNYNVIRNNTCSFNLRNGISLWSYVYKTATVNYNNITDNVVNANSILAYYGGIDIGKSIGNYLSGNIVSSNALAIYLNSVFDSKFFHNTFLNNSAKVHIYDDQESGSSSNTWDYGYPSGGNYWSDYNGSDTKSGPDQTILGSDGIGDTPYEIGVNNTDRYPLMLPYQTPSPTPTPTPEPTPTPPPTPSPTPTPTPISIPSPTPTPTPITLLPATIALSIESSAEYSGFSAKISGTLTAEGKGLPNAGVHFYVSVSGGTSWDALSFVNTDSDGKFTVAWRPSVTVNYLLNATWEGNTEYPATSTIVNFASTPYEEESVFSVTSNSTLSGLVFDSANTELRFIVSGPTETTGYVDVVIPKTLISDISSLKVCVDGSQLSFNSISQTDSWVISFTYQHSSHEISLNMSSGSSSSSGENLFCDILPYVTLAAITAVIAAVLVSIRNKKSNGEGKLDLPSSKNTRFRKLITSEN
jgi:parallel beta-helix repeat protein